MNTWFALCYISCDLPPSTLSSIMYNLFIGIGKLYDCPRSGEAILKNIAEKTQANPPETNGATTMK